MKKKILLFISLIMLVSISYAFNITLNESNSTNLVEENNNIIDNSSLIITPEEINPYKNNLLKEIKFNDLSYTPVKGINSKVKLKSKLLTTNEKIYAIMQFNRNPSKEERLELGKNGVLVLDFISSNSYYVSINQDLDKTFETNFDGDLKLKDINFNDKYIIRSIDEIKPEYKLSKNLMETKTREMLVDKNENLYVIVKFHKDVTLSQAKKLMNKNDIKVISEIETLNALVVNLGGGENK